MTVSRRETAGEPSDEPVPEIQSKPVSINTYGSQPGNPEQPREYLYLFLGAINLGAIRRANPEIQNNPVSIYTYSLGQSTWEPVQTYPE